jgi:hypothetical protein
MNSTHGTRLHTDDSTTSYNYRKHSNIFCDCSYCQQFDSAVTAPVQKSILPYPDATILVKNIFAEQAHKEDPYWTYDDTSEHLPTMPLESAGDTILLPSLEPVLNTVTMVTAWTDPATGKRVPVYWPVH